MVNIIFGAFSREYKVDWGIVIRDVVLKLVCEVGKPKATSICPYIFHLYQSLDILREEEIVAYEAL